MLVFQKGVGCTETIKFVDINKSYLCEASIKDIRAKSYTLQYDRYIQRKYNGGFIRSSPLINILPFIL
jgi:hypothetical protein